MSTERFEFDSAVGGDSTLAENVATFKFSSNHLAEITALTDTIVNPATKKLVFQRLPKHMLRRAMSHNPKRLPRKYRQAHTSQMKKSGTPTNTKRPSRKYRRKPCNLLVEYHRRQRRVKWLETHIWHAKRFHMVDKWGYRLAQSTCDKTFRSSYRASTNHCLLQDISYIGCIEVSGPLELLRAGFNRMRCAKLGLGICAKAYTSGLRAGTADIFRTDTYPLGALGQINFIWKQEVTETPLRTLWIFVHPTIYDDFVDEIKNLFQLTEKTPVNDQEKYINSEQFTPLPSYQNIPEQIQLTELKDSLNRFRLTGPLSQGILSAAFKCKPLLSDDVTWFGEHIRQNEFAAIVHSNQNIYWNLLENVKSPTELPRNITIGLNIEDPRITRPKKRTKAVPGSSSNIVTAEATSCHIPTHGAVSAIWNETTRHKILNEKMTTHELCGLRNRHVLIPGQRCPFENNLQPVPVLLCQRPGISGSDRLGYGSGWDIIVPQGYGISTWICLVMWGARPGGLRETETISRESGQDEFLPDTQTAVINDNLLAEKLRERYFRRPPNRRINFRKLSISSPFQCPWPQLIADWSNEAKYDNYFVIRERNILEQLKSCLKNHRTATRVNLPENCLIPVTIDLDGRGIARKFSIICLPKRADFTRERVLRETLTNKPIYSEPSRLDTQEFARKLLRSNHIKLLKRLRRRRIRTKRRQQETAQRKVLVANAATAKLIAAQRETMNEMWLPKQPIRIRNQCSREVFGYLTQAHFSFIKGKVAGIGYITSNGFQSLLRLYMKKNSVPKVLVRDPNSVNYRKATLKIRIY